MKALDSSILAGQLINVDEEIDSFSDDDHLHIYLRIKDGIQEFKDLYKVPDPQTIISKIPEGTRNTKDDIIMKKYNFTKIFEPKTTQAEIFSELVKPKLLKFINGQNSTLLTYGVSSSGKTYTIVGTAEMPGLLPRSLEYIFSSLPDIKEAPIYKPVPYGKIIRLTEDEIIKERQFKEEILNFKWSNSAKCEHINTYDGMKNRLSGFPGATLADNCPSLSVSLWVSFAEIYNEHIYDLLQTKEMKKEKLKLGCANGKTYVKNLTIVHVTSGLEAYQVLQYGLHHLNYAKTNINSHSSRSHSIFTIWLTQTGKDFEEESHISHFNFCDLAGAERSKKTLNVGDRLKESNNINTSLLVLGRCIAAVRKAQQYSKQNIIPFRESKLTQLFQNALSGLEDICMIVNINPCKELWEETQHVLNFSAIAKDIVVSKPPSVPVRRSERITQLLSQRLDTAIGTEKENRLEKLKNELAEIVEQLEMEDMNQMKEIELMRNEIISEYNQIQEDRKEEMEYEILALRKGLMEDNERKLQAIKSEIMQRYGLSEDEPDESSSEEVINVSSDEESDSDPYKVETVNLVSSDEEMEEEEEEEEEIDKWRRKVRTQEDQIAERQKTIFDLRKRIDELKLKINTKASEKSFEEKDFEEEDFEEKDVEESQELDGSVRKKRCSLPNQIFTN